jgi:hypothetical protein
MASPDKRSLEIADAFTRYLDAKEDSLLESFTREEIEIALLQFFKDGGLPYYVEMQTRREELKEEEHKRDAKRRKWKDGIIVFIGGLILGTVLLFLKLAFFG